MEHVVIAFFCNPSYSIALSNLIWRGNMVKKDAYIFTPGPVLALWKIEFLCILEKPLTTIKQITVIDGMGDLLKRNPNLEALETKIDELSSLHNTLLVTTNSDKILTTRVGYVISESTLFQTKVTKLRISSCFASKLDSAKNEQNDIIIRRDGNEFTMPSI